jgi:hypothetical protein
LAAIKTAVNARALQSTLTHATNGLAAIKTAVNARASQTDLDTVQNSLADATSGLSAIKTVCSASLLLHRHFSLSIFVVHPSVCVFIRTA